MGKNLLICFSLLLTLFSISVTARPGPCNTLIFFTTTSTSSYPITDRHVINPATITVFFTQIRPILPFPQTRPVFPEPDFPKPDYELDSLVGDSFKDRSKDILRVVASLMFGVGCGVLTSATLYLVWSLFAPARFGYEDDEEEDDEEVGFEKEGFEKGGYIAIPCKGSPVKDVV